MTSAPSSARLAEKRGARRFDSDGNGDQGKQRKESDAQEGRDDHVQEPLGLVRPEPSPVWKWDSSVVGLAKTVGMSPPSCDSHSSLRPKDRSCQPTGTP